MAVTMHNITELEMVLDARQWLLANGGTADELAANAAAIRKYADEQGCPDVYTQMGLDDGTPRSIPGGGGGRRHTTHSSRQARMFASPEAQKYAVSLIGQVWADDPTTAAELAVNVPTMTATEVSRLIDTAKLIVKDHQPPRMVTKGQKRYLTSLTHNLMGGDPDLLAAIDTMTFDQAKKALDILTKLPAAQHRPKIAEATGVKTVERPEREPIVEGMYRDPDGTVIKVQVAHHGSGKLYAKRLVVLDQPRELKNGKVAGGEFVYTAGLINKVQPEWRMTLDEAMEWGQLYGICCRCGTVLTDDQPGGSIERGIGPVCAKKF